MELLRLRRSVPSGPDCGQANRVRRIVLTSRFHSAPAWSACWCDDTLCAASPLSIFTRAWSPSYHLVRDLFRSATSSYPEENWIRLALACTFDSTSSGPVSSSLWTCRLCEPHSAARLFSSGLAPRSSQLPLARHPLSVQHPLARHLPLGQHYLSYAGEWPGTKRPPSLKLRRP